jgi:hypothetical protein
MMFVLKLNFHNLKKIKKLSPLKLRFFYSIIEFFCNLIFPFSTYPLLLIDPLKNEYEDFYFLIYFY